MMQKQIIYKFDGYIIECYRIAVLSAVDPAYDHYSTKIPSALHANKYQNQVSFKYKRLTKISEIGKLVCKKKSKIC